MTMAKISDTLNRQSLMKMTLSKWCETLADECGVYRLGDQYIGKAFDTIPYKLCSKEKAKDILEENLDALLTFKYFPHASDEEADRIKDIKKYCVNRIASSLIKVKFDRDSTSARYMKPLPPSCIAFNNGVYDFKADRWFFRYSITEADLSKQIIQYPYDYRIMWYINRDFTPMKMSINDDGSMGMSAKGDDEDGASPLALSFDEWLDFMKDLDTKRPSKFFELLWNMSYNGEWRFDMSKAEHLAEIFGFAMYSDFVQHFVFFVGDGSNGKDSMFDSFMRDLIRPIPSGNSVTDLEEDKFVMSSLVGVSQNISSETETNLLKHSARLKQLTGSPYQTIEEKGVDKYTGYMNCKFIFSANNKEQLKFGDSSVGFRRRINMYECFFQWDKHKDFLKKMKGTYDTTYKDTDEMRAGDSFSEFFYTAMQGVKMATSNFTAPFSFTENDYAYEEYADIDTSLMSAVNHITASRLARYVKYHTESARAIFYTESWKRLDQDLTEGTHMGFVDYYDTKDFPNALVTALSQESEGEETYGVGKWFVDNMFYISLDVIKELCEDKYDKSKAFLVSFRKSFPKSDIGRHSQNKAYVKAEFTYDGVLKIR